jgi:hypothetical protein
LTSQLTGFRAAAFVLVALSALTGVVSRVATARSDAPAFAGVGSLGLSPGQPFGRGVFDGIADDEVPSVRLKASQCGEPVYATPLELKSVAQVDLADRAYLSHSGYGATNVYRGEVHPTFSHIARILARNPLTPYKLDYFVRFYAPSGCAIDDRAYVEWAGMILALGTAPARPGG